MSIQKKIRALWRPEMYHGWGKSTSYFEGWYLKMIDSTRSHAYAIIPGISLGDNGENHAFIQVLDGMAKKSYYYKFDVAEFQPGEHDFSLTLGDNHFGNESHRHRNGRHAHRGFQVLAIFTSAITTLTFIRTIDIVFQIFQTECIDWHYQRNTQQRSKQFGFHDASPPSVI